MQHPRSIPEQIVVATGNPHKVAELNALLAHTPLGESTHFTALSDLPGGPWEEPAEGSQSFEANASLKALSYARQTGRACLADDSGLIVDALGGAPGVISSHYATDGAETGLTRDERDSANNQRLLAEMAAVPREQRTARFVCVMMLAVPTDGGADVIAQARGEFEGRIGLEGDVPRGDEGFGYDPLFLVAPDFTQTSAELEPVVKNAISHRAKAAAAMIERIKELRD